MDPESTVITCYRRPRVECHVRRTRCERFICPDCMREAAVGHLCPECVGEGARSARTIVGGRITAVPVVTYVPIALNVLVHLAEMVWPEAVNRSATVGARPVDPDGGFYVFQPEHSAEFHVEGATAGEWYRMLTGAFLNRRPPDGMFETTHILVNMVFLWQLGRTTETRQPGRVRCLALYLLSALDGSALVLQVVPTGAKVTEPTGEGIAS